MEKVDRGVTVFSSRIERWQLRPGDHIYTWRDGGLSGYSHHGIYESNEKVIHYTDASAAAGGGGGGSSSSRSRSRRSGRSWFRFSSAAPVTTCRRGDCAEAERKGGVVVTCLDCFLDGGNICLFVYSVTPVFYKLSNMYSVQDTCSKEPEDPPKEVLQRANDLFATDGFGSYDLNKNNCMHFAIYCKTGRRYSKQVVVSKIIEFTIGVEPEAFL